MSMPDTSDTAKEPENGTPSGNGRPGWLLCTLVILTCLGVIASGWGVTRLAVGGPERFLEAPDSPEPRPPGREMPVADVAPEDAAAFVEAAADGVDSASGFDMAFVVHGGKAAAQNASEREPTRPAPGRPGAVPVSRPDPDAGMGRGRVVYDADAAPVFEHFFTTLTGTQVYRYDMGDGQLVMTAGTGATGLVVLDPPAAADRYLCSRDFGSAKLREVLRTSADLELAGREDLELQWSERRATYSTYRYTGTFTATLGSYDSRTASNSLTTVEHAEFELWIDGRGYPRRFAYRSDGGVGETHEYISFT